MSSIFRISTKLNIELFLLWITMGFCLFAAGTMLGLSSLFVGSLLCSHLLLILLPNLIPISGKQNKWNTFFKQIIPLVLTGMLCYFYAPTLLEGLFIMLAPEVGMILSNILLVCSDLKSYIAKTKIEKQFIDDIHAVSRSIHIPIHEKIKLKVLSKIPSLRKSIVDKSVPAIAAASIGLTQNLFFIDNTLFTNKNRKYTRKELVGVIWHEFGHLYRNDSLKSALNIILYNTTLILCLLSGSLVGIGLLAITHLASYRISRASEFLADNFSAEHNHAADLISFFEKTEKMEEKNESVTSNYFLKQFIEWNSTHPSHSSRISMLKEAENEKRTQFCLK